MTRLRHHRRARLAAAGFSLVELLIALTIGLLVIAGIGSMFLGSSQAYRTQNAVTQIEEAGRFASLFLTPIVREAGYLPDPVNQTQPALYFRSNASSSKRAIYGLDDFSNSASPPTPIAGFDRSKVMPGTDVLIVSFAGRNTASATDSPLRTCLGNDLSDADSMAVNIFYVRKDGNGAPGLYCTYNVSGIADATDGAATDSSTQPIVTGIRDMQVLYGVDGNDDFDADYYQKADAVTDWTRIASVRITFAVDSLDASERGQVRQSVTSGGRITQTFTTTIQIRNRLRA